MRRHDKRASWHSERNWRPIARFLIQDQRGAAVDLDGLAHQGDGEIGDADLVRAARRPGVGERAQRLVERRLLAVPVVEQQIDLVGAQHVEAGR